MSAGLVPPALDGADAAALPAFVAPLDGDGAGFAVFAPADLGEVAAVGDGLDLVRIIVDLCFVFSVCSSLEVPLLSLFYVF